MKKVISHEEKDLSPEDNVLSESTDEMREAKLRKDPVYNIIIIISSGSEYFDTQTGVMYHVISQDKLYDLKSFVPTMKDFFNLYTKNELIFNSFGISLIIREKYPDEYNLLFRGKRVGILLNFWDPETRGYNCTVYPISDIFDRYL